MSPFFFEIFALSLLTSLLSGVLASFCSFGFLGFCLLDFLVLAKSRIAEILSRFESVDEILVLVLIAFCINSISRELNNLPNCGFLVTASRILSNSLK